ncbi:MAG: MFS transporter [Sphaerochaetaceae bacterium]|nr:MFS transporter [Spirochaetales bacterium]MDY5499002.1 MFS transporter [Sphaerochaetaceae bacterium]
MLFPLLLATTGLTGLTQNLYGTISTNIQTATGISAEGIGYVMSLGQAATVLAVFAYPTLVRRTGPYRALILGCLGYALGFFLIGCARSVALFAAAYTLWAIIQYPLAGSKFALMTHYDPAKKSPHLAEMHLCYSIVSIFNGFYVAFCKKHAWYLAFWQTGLLFALLGVGFILARKEAEKIPAMIHHDTHGESGLQDGFSLLADPAYLCYFPFIATAATAEGLSMVYPLMFIEQNLKASADQVGLVVTLFFTGMTISRILVVCFFSRAKHPGAFLSGFATIATICLARLSFSTLSEAMVLMPVMGFAMGAINPLCHVFSSTLWNERIDQAMNMQSFGETAGKIVVPLLVGLAWKTNGGAFAVQAMGMLVALGIVCFMASLVLLSKR